MRNINNLVKRYENLTELENTTSEDFLGASSFYLLNDGRYLNTESFDGIRANDHRIIFGATRINSYDNKAWHKLQCNYQLIRIIPECNMLMIDTKQIITREQQQKINELINYYDFTIEYYIN